MLLYNYDTQWPLNYKKLKTRLSEALNDIPLKIEHVGSTSVPYCTAKPIIDIDIVFDEADYFINIKNRLESLGYYHNGDQGIKGREVLQRRKALYI